MQNDSVVDSSTCNVNTAADESREISPPVSDATCDSGSSPHALTAPHKESYDRIRESSLNILESEQQEVRKTARETFERLAENDRTKCNGSCPLEKPRRITQKSIVRSESCPTGAASYIKERTVGKVSSAIDAKAQKLAVLYETDHRPNATLCVVRKDFGGSDVCHFCTKRVYVMERLSAEGYFFHRECFRCEVCNGTLRLGGHVFDSQEAKFYCKMHYTQRQSSTHTGTFRRRMEDQRRVTTDSRGFSATGGVPLQPPGAASSSHSEQLDEDQRRVPEDAEMAVEALDAAFIVTPATQDPAGARGQSQDGTKDHCNPKRNNRWRRKIRATFPLLFKHFQRSWPQDKEAPETVPEVDSDFEEITSTEKPTNSEGSSETSADPQNPSEGSEKSEEHSAQTACNSSSQKKRLALSPSEKEKLLSWDMVTPEEAPSNTRNARQQKIQVQAEAAVDKLQTDSGQSGEPSPSQTCASSPSALQLIADAFRRTFSVTNASSGSSAAGPIRAERDGPRRQRPMSEGALSFSAAGPEPPGDEERAGKCEARWASVGANAWGAGRDLPSLLQQVSLKGRRDSGGVSSDDAALLRGGRRVNLFSSLRLRKREESEGEGRDQEAQKEIRTILANLRNKASRQQNVEEPSSSSDDENPASNQKLCPERQRRRQEKTVARQAKREQLMRLHRAQTIQRQLEEVAEKQRDLEERGVAVEKIIRGETESSQTDDSDEAQLHQSWFRLVLEKNRLERYESELMISAQELELQDTQSRLQRDLRHRMATEDTTKSASELQEEQAILSEIMRTVERRDALVSVLEEQRLKERAEDRDLESQLLSRGHEFLWAPADDGCWGGGGGPE